MTGVQTCLPILSNINQAAGVVGSAGQLATGVGQGLVAAGTGGAAGAFVGSQAGSNIGQGAIGIGTGIRDYTMGKTEADVASMTGQGLDYLKQMDPVKMRQMQAVVSNLGSVTRFGRTYGQDFKNLGGTEDPFVAMMRAGREAGGLETGESMGMMAQLRESLGTKGAWNAMGSAASAERRFGIDREAGVAGIAGLSRMASSDTSADQKLTKILSRAMTLGLDDSKLQSSIVAALPGKLEGTGGGRAGAMGSIESMMAMAQSIASGRGAAQADMRDLGEAQSGSRALESLTSGGASAGLGVATKAATMAAIRGLVPKENAFMLSTLPTSEIQNMTQSFVDLAGTTDPAKLQEIAKAVLEARGEAVKNVVGSGAAATQAGRLLTGEQSYSGVKAALGEANNLGKWLSPQERQGEGFGIGGASFVAGGMGFDLKKEQGLTSDVGNRQKALEQGLSNPELMGQIANVITAAGGIADSIAKMDPATLGNVPQLLGDVSEQLGKLGDAA